jgi:hypothetical protein|nr:MAG TPA: hypothetical protein [Caudoviricetes sp.]DAY81761.1 MAG TPA: hypothetical protein [Caudoviricetes sp.]
MALEDNFLNKDPQNYQTELEFLLNSGSLSFDDCEALFGSKKITKEDFEYCKEYFEEV